MGGFDISNGYLHFVSFLEVSKTAEQEEKNSNSIKFNKTSPNLSRNHA